MFRLHRHKSEKSGEKFEFKFSHLHALQVPKGWDKLVVSIILAETGKTIAKSGKVPVRNGNCRWIETFAESIWIQQDDAQKEIEECFIKLVVTMGSSRSGILGEALVNLASYMSSKNPVPITLPLKKCDSGAILQLKVQCLTPRAKIRDEQWRDTNSDMEDQHVDYDEMENKSDMSDGTFAKSVGSSSSNQLDGATHTGEPCSRNTSFSPSSHNSFDSVEGSLGRDTYSSLSYSGRQDSIGSQSSSPYGSYSFNEASRSNQSSSFKASREDFNRVPRAAASSPLQNAGSSKEVVEAAEVTIEELCAEARMWEQNARKLMIDLEKLKKESLDQSTRQASLERQLSESHTQCDGLKEEIEQLKKLIEESQLQPTAAENSMFQAKEMEMMNELEDEIKFQKESNANLAVQLEKTQESNIELLSILQELEETIAKQKMEIDDLSKTKSEFEEVQIHGHAFGDNMQTNTTKQMPEKKIRDTYCDADVEGSIAEHPIRDLNTEVECEDDRNLELELQQLKEAKKNLESTIQSLEKSVEDKGHEIEMERDLMTQTLLHHEAGWKIKLAEKEEKIFNLEAKLSDALTSTGLKEKGFENVDDHDLIKEVDILKQKVLELERDCNELTDENLELLFKLKESRNELLTGTASLHEYADHNSIFTSESEVCQLKSQICKLEEELKRKNVLIERLSTDKKKSDDLECHLETLKDKACYLDGELSKCRFKLQEREIEIVALQQRLELYQGIETESKDHPVAVCPQCKIFESDTFVEMFELLSQLHEHIQFSIANLKGQQSSLYSCSPANTLGTCGSDKSTIPTGTDLISQKEQAEALLNNFIELKKLLEEKNNVSDDEIQTYKVRAMEANTDIDQNKLPILEVESQHMEFKSEVPESAKELFEKMSEINILKSDNLLKEEEVKTLRLSLKELETRISDLEKEKIRLEGSMEVVLQEHTITSKCLDDLRNEMMVLDRDMDSQVSHNKILERKSSELESSKHELEVHLHELEEENVQLSERICGLEAQLRYLTNERESSRLELENSATHAMSLQDEIRRLKAEMETQKVEMKQKLNDMQKRWLGVQEECEYLKMANPKLQATAEGLIEECSFLQKSNAELRKQKMNLHEHCAVLEAQVGESEESFSDLSMKVEALEEKYSSMLEEISSKEKALNLELDALLNENRKHKDKLVMEESLINQMYMEKTVEVQNLQREIAHLTEQISTTQDEKDRTASEAVLEVSHLRSDKAVLEAGLLEIQGKLKLSESNLNSLQMESQTKVQQLTSELAAANQNQEVLVADHEKLLDLLEHVKSNEENLKSLVRGLELKLKAAEYENLQLAEEISSLKAQLERTSLLQDEVLSLKKSLNEAKFEKERLEASFQMISVDYEELKAERTSIMQKISSSQQAVSELEDCKRKKVALQEKVLRLEGDLTAIVALGSQEAALKNELAQIRRENNQLQRRIKNLEKEKEECLSRAQVLEEELKHHKEVNHDSCKSVVNLPLPDSNATSTSIQDKVHPSLMPLKSLEQEKNTPQDKKTSTETCQLRYLSYAQDTGSTYQNQKQVGNTQNSNLGSSKDMQIDSLSKIQSLENELAEALEANGMYKAQLKSLLSQGFSSQLDTTIKSTGEQGTAKKDGYDLQVSSLEAELRDLQERYFQMSLKYAEVEAQREQLVMQLKSVNSGRRKWFS